MRGIEKIALGEITEDIREAWVIANNFPRPSLIGHLTDALRDQLAAKLKAEFWQDHDRVSIAFRSGYEAPLPDFECKDCGTKDFDPRHKYEDAEWQVEAERILKGVD